MLENNTILEIDVKQQYDSTMDSVNIVNGVKPDYMIDSEWIDQIARNKEHIKLMILKEFWTNEDLTPFHDAVK
jgi:hypothetical protein